MRDFLVIFIEVAYAVLQHPTELPVYIRRIPSLERHVMTAVGLTALAAALAVYLLRDYYDGTVWLVFPLLGVVHAAALGGGALFFGLVTDVLISRVSPDRPRQAGQMVAIAMLALLPLSLVLPLTFPIRFAAVRLGIPPVIPMIPVVLALCVWAFMVAVRGLQYLYEIPLRRAVVAGLQATLIVALFPAIVALLFALDVAQLLS